MTTQVTTGIVLRRRHRTGQYQLTRAGSDQATEFAPELQLHEIAAGAGLQNGYWLRDTPQFEERDGGRVVAVATTWTWVQL